MSFSPLLSANAYLSPPEMGPAQFAKSVQKAGYGGIAWTMASLQAEGADGLRTLSRAHGLAITTLNSAGYFTWQDPERQKAQNATSLGLIESAAKMEAQRLVIIAGGIDGGLDAACPNSFNNQQSLPDARNRVIEGLAVLDARAGELGVRLSLEPIHPVDQLRKGCIHSVAEGIELVSTLANTDLALDVYHSAWDKDFHLWPTSDLSVIGLIQLCNIYEPSPEAKPQRNLPLEGRIDLEAIVAHYIARGYKGPFEFEMFDHHRQGRSVEMLLTTAFEQLTQIFAGSKISALRS